MKYVNWQNKKVLFGYLIICLLSLVIVILFSSHICAEGDNALFIDQNGNVGIGTDKPMAKFDVAGTVSAKAFVGDGAIPTGVIAMWSGNVDEIPEGWVLCDGNNDTPDLRDRFIIGAPLSDPSFANPVGGSKTHQHEGSTGDPDKVEFKVRPGENKVPSPEHIHEYKTPEANHIPPYYALVFIMKL